MDRISTHGSMIEQINLSGVPRSGFDMSYHNFLTGRLGAIIPTAVKEVIPGDRIKGDTHIVTQFEPLASPIMGNMVQKEETFFVPYSAIWDKAHRFFTGKKGFDDEMPAFSLYDLWLDLANEYLTFVLGDFYDKTDPNDILLNLKKIKEIPLSFGSSGLVLPIIEDNGLTDLFKPLISRLNPIINQLKDVIGAANFAQDSLHIKNYDFDSINDLVATYCYQFIDFWFGPSSMFDYMGAGFIGSEFLTHLKKQNRLAYSDPNYSYYSAEINWLEQYNVKRSWFPFRAAYWCWYWNYRDQLIETNVIDPEEEMFSSAVTTNEVIACLLLRQRCWFKDTFTTALTNTGDANMVVPITEDTFHVISNDANNLENTSDNSAVDSTERTYYSISIGGITYKVPSLYLNSTTLKPDNVSELNVQGVSLNLLDRARRLSSWLSKRLVLGTEYDDVVYSSFMVKLSNVRMRVPELLAAGRTQVSINTVVNNTNTADDTAGNKSAVAYADNYGNTQGINYYSEEHGLLLSFMTVLPIQSYPAQIQRLFFKRNRFDFAWPEFAQLGMDAVYTSELTGAVAMDEDTALTVFGYQGRYYDYKCNQDEEHGRLHTDLNYLTFGRIWNPEDAQWPKLNAEFIHCWPRTDMFVVDDGVTDLFRADVHHRWAMERCLPVPSDVLR